MNIRGKLKNIFVIRMVFFALKWYVPAKILGDRKMIERLYRKKMGFIPNLDNPETLSEKIQWLKLYDRKPFYTMVADKYCVKEYYRENFGEEYVVPLLCKFDSWRDIKPANLPDEPFVIKANTGTGTWRIVRDKNHIDYKALRREARDWMLFNHYYESQEWQYKNIKPCIIVEKLLTDSQGRIPNDYKLHYMNGELQFIYCVADREKDNYRAMFSPEWELLPFQWVSPKNHARIRTSVEVSKPKTLDKMIEFGNKIAQNFKCVRVDYYEVEGRLYFGEITLYHGTGMNKFYPPEAERTYVDKLTI